jgi:hypothetical protein
MRLANKPRNVFELLEDGNILSFRSNASANVYALGLSNMLMEILTNLVLFPGRPTAAAISWQYAQEALSEFRFLVDARHPVNKDTIRRKEGNFIL